MSRVELNQTAVRTFGRRNGAIAVKKVQAVALSGSKRMAPRSPAHLSGSRVPVRGPRLVEQIKATPVTFRGWNVEARIESRSRITLVDHEGSKAHRISARRKKALKFFWVRTVARQYGRRRIRPGQASYFKWVMHPGNRRPVKFLTTPLAVSARLNNFFFRKTR
jgi:hypothetical protein